MIPLLFQTPISSPTHFEQQESSIVVYITVHFYNSKDIHSTWDLIYVVWFVLYLILFFPPFSTFQKIKHVAMYIQPWI